MAATHLPDVESLLPGGVVLVPDSFWRLAAAVGAQPHAEQLCFDDDNVRASHGSLAAAWALAAAASAVVLGPLRASWLHGEGSAAAVVATALSAALPLLCLLSLRAACRQRLQGNQVHQGAEGAGAGGLGLCCSLCGRRGQGALDALCLTRGAGSTGHRQAVRSRLHTIASAAGAGAAAHFALALFFSEVAPGAHSGARLLEQLCLVLWWPPLLGAMWAWAASLLCAVSIARAVDLFDLHRHSPRRAFCEDNGGGGEGEGEGPDELALRLYDAAWTRPCAAVSLSQCAVVATQLLLAGTIKPVLPAVWVVACRLLVPAALSAACLSGRATLLTYVDNDRDGRSRNRSSSPPRLLEHGDGLEQTSREVREELQQLSREISPTKH